VNVKAKFLSRNPFLQSMRKANSALSLLACMVGVVGAEYLVLFLNPPKVGRFMDSQIWVANGILLAYLLLVPKWKWRYYIPGGAIALLLLAVILAGKVSGHSLLMATLNLLETLISAYCLRRRTRDLPHFTETGYLVRFTLFALILGPAVAGTINALISAIFLHQAPLPLIGNWILVDALGTATVTPACIAIFRTPLRLNQASIMSWIYPILLIELVFSSHVSATDVALSLIYPLVLLILVNFGLPLASIATILIAATYNWSVTESHILSPTFRLQLFVGTTMFLLYSVSIVLDRKSAVEEQLREIAELHREVTEYSRDALIISDTKFRRLYVSSETEKMGGWTRAEVYAHNSLQLVHPDDLPRVQMALEELYKNDVAMIEARAQRKDGSYLWIEASLRVIRDPKSGQIHRILNIVRDISERKQSERKLQEAYNAVEALAVTDSLTGLANRRRFDQYMGVEWRRSARDQQPLSVLMLDADHFKSYNDTYGHQRGDSCLKQIAEACMDVVSRPGDLVARFGGEEFVVILPNTENAGALLVAEEIAGALRSRRLPHAGNGKGIVTISIGCATLIPKFSGHPSDLIELADRALYQAKDAGRDRVCNGNAIEEDTPITV